MRSLSRRLATLVMLTGIFLVGAAGSALACGGLVTPNGTVSLLKTTTLAAYHEGIEHYVTSFEFAGEGQEVGSIIPLPGVPTDVIKAGDWTLQRLILETQPPVPGVFRAAALATGAEGYVTKARMGRELLLACKEILAGRTFCRSEDGKRVGRRV